MPTDRAVVSMNGAAADFQPGDRIADKYIFERELGRGGMGRVVAARHVELDALVAIKFLLPGRASDERSLARFRQEARAALRIKSEHVAHVLDIGKLPDATPFIVMEYLDGQNLADHLARQGPLPVAEAVGLLLQACEALAEAHALGIVHRDLKPGNLFLCRKGTGSTTLKVMDFGVSKVDWRAEDLERTGWTTRTGAVVGSPSYMAPEQIRESKSVDHRADIWSLGVLLFELVTDRRPFENQSAGGLLSAILDAPPLPLSAVWTRAPAGLQSVIERALCKDVDARYPSVSAFRDAIRAFASCSDRFEIDSATKLGGTTTTAAVSGPAPRREAAPAPAAREKTLSAPQPRSGVRARLWIPLGLGVIAVALGGLGLRATQAPSKGAAAGPPALSSHDDATPVVAPTVPASLAASQPAPSADPPAASARSRDPAKSAGAPPRQPRTDGAVNELEGLIDERR